MMVDVPWSPRSRECSDDVAGLVPDLALFRPCIRDVTRLAQEQPSYVDSLTDIGGRGLEGICQAHVTRHVRRGNSHTACANA